MWLFIRTGFYSIVEKPADREAEMLTVRARTQSDLDALRQHYLPALGATETSQHTDYRYRARAPREAVAAALLRAVIDIDYSNFKKTVAEEQGHDRAELYSQVWGVLYRLQGDDNEKAPATKHWNISKADAYGGILLTRTGQILLREPANHFDGYVWTFAKGWPDSKRGDRCPEETALREVQEETGYVAEIVDVLPGVFKSRNSITAFFVMRHFGIQGRTEWETHATRCVDFEQAAALIGQSTNTKGRQRDLAILAAAKEWFTRNQTVVLPDGERN